MAWERIYAGREMANNMRGLMVRCVSARHLVGGTDERVAAGHYNAATMATHRVHLDSRGDENHWEGAGFSHQRTDRYGQVDVWMVGGACSMYATGEPCGGLELPAGHSSMQV